MEKYRGAHGTSILTATIIQAKGFKIPEYWPGQSQYGPGVYMYKDGVEARAAALAWARFKYSNEDACVLLPSFDYDDNACIHLPPGFEDIVQEKASLRAQSRNMEKLPEEEENQIRERCLEYIAQRKGLEDPQAIFTRFPCRNGSVPSFLEGCCLRDAGLLDPPPYEEFI